MLGYYRYVNPGRVAGRGLAPTPEGWSQTSVLRDAFEGQAFGGIMTVSTR